MCVRPLGLTRDLVGSNKLTSMLPVLFAAPTAPPVLHAPHALVVLRSRSPCCPAPPVHAVRRVPTCERGEGRHDEQRQAVQQMKSDPRSCWEDERLPQGKPVIPQVSVIRPSCTVVFTAVCYLINLFTLRSLHHDRGLLHNQSL